MLTHPDKRLFDDPPVTKGELADYYRQVAAPLLEDGGRRPVSLLRCPDGIDGECFFQKHAGSGLPDAVHTLQITEKDGNQASYLCVDDADGLVALVQLGTVELHVWNARVDALETPDRIVFDLDPGQGIGWNDMVDAARRLRDCLQDLGLASWVRTSGGKGLHVLVPLEAGPGWDATREFAQAVARKLAEADPDRFLARADKDRRKGRIFIDYLRNSRGATSIVNYSVRARPGAGVATPLRWDELGRLDGPGHYHVGNVPRRLAQLDADPWAGLASAAQALPSPKCI